MIGLIRRASEQRSALAQVRAALSEGFGADGPEVARLIKDGPLARVTEARWQGRTVIVKQFRTASPQQQIADMLAEHERLATYFPHDGLHFARICGAAPAQGLAVVEKAPGIPLDQALDPCTPDARRHLVTRAGFWLSRALGDSRDQGSFRPRFWLNRLEGERDLAKLAPSDRDKMCAAHQALSVLGQRLKHGPVPRGAVHGDFGPYNLHWDATSQSLWAFDIQCTSALPLALDMARLLVALSEQVQRQHPDCTLALGVLPEDIAALLTVPGLEHDQSELPYLDFFLGYRLLRTLIEKHDHPHAPILRRSLANWLDTPRCL